MKLKGEGSGRVRKELEQTECGDRLDQSTLSGCMKAIAKEIAKQNS